MPKIPSKKLASNLLEDRKTGLSYLIMEWNVPSANVASRNCRTNGVKCLCRIFFPERGYRRVTLLGIDLGMAPELRDSFAEHLPGWGGGEGGAGGGRGGRIGGGGTGGGGGEGGGGGGERLTSIGRRFCFSAETGGALNK